MFYYVLGRSDLFLKEMEEERIRGGRAEVGVGGDWEERREEKLLRM